ncbi:hypothetical protein ACOSP7_012750 [Xanthoceras sorbifolium]
MSNILTFVALTIDSFSSPFHLWLCTGTPGLLDGGGVFILNPAGRIYRTAAISFSELGLMIEVVPFASWWLLTCNIVRSL